jgi:Spy/CpxP family protein refolding chaperone
MRRTIMAGMALALTLGVASVSQAQQTDHSKADSAHHGEHMQRGERGGRGGPGMLLKGIDLTDAQKAQIKALHEQQGRPSDVQREQREKMRAEMQERHEKMLTEVRSILTPAQREIFEKNVADMKEHMKDRREHMKQRRGEGRGERRS